MYLILAPEGDFIFGDISFNLGANILIYAAKKVNLLTNKKIMCNIFNGGFSMAVTILWKIFKV